MFQLLRSPASKLLEVKFLSMLHHICVFCSPKNRSINKRFRCVSSSLLLKPRWETNNFLRVPGWSTSQRSRFRAAKVCSLVWAGDLRRGITFFSLRKYRDAAACDVVDRLLAFIAWFSMHAWVEQGLKSSRQDSSEERLVSPVAVRWSTNPALCNFLSTRSF